MFFFFVYFRECVLSKEKEEEDADDPFKKKTCGAIYVYVRSLKYISLVNETFLLFKVEKGENKTYHVFVTMRQTRWAELVLIRSE